MLKIITNNHWREFKYANEVPQEVLNDQFDWMDDPSEHTFFQYRNTWYSLDDIMRIENHNDDTFSSWHGYSSDSFFSGIVVRLSDCGDMYQVGLYLS